MTDDTDSCGCHGDTERAQHDPAYRRALWIVVVLNVGFGLFEIVGGFLAGLGVFVIGMAAWRALNAVPPEAELMGGIGIAALAVNVVAAWILSRFKEGDSNVRAVWLFSRNDALANVAVIVAAGLVYWTQSAWPDLVVAAAIALLFLHSATEIIKDARRELNEPAHVS